MTNLQKYTDMYGRIHIKPVTEENPLPTNNAYIYSFYAHQVGLLEDYLDFSDEVVDEIVDIDETVISRHPGKRPPEIVPISHDEYVGLAGLDECNALDILEYGTKNHWQFCDIPGFKPTPFRKLVIDDVLAAYEDLANDKDTNIRRAVVKYPALHPITFWHRPDQQYFYYRCANRSPGTFRTLYFIAATLVSIAQNDPRSVMLGFKFLKLKNIGLNFIEKMLYKVYQSKVDFKQNCRNYFPEDHPILEKVLNS